MEYRGWFLFFSIASLFGVAGSIPAAAQVDPEARMEQLLSRMTVEEKVGQLVQYAEVTDEYKALLKKGMIGSLLNVKGAAQANAVQEIAVKQTRLGIPLLLGFDVIHGYRTIFPIPLAEACSWDPVMVERTAAIAAKEAAAAGIRWTFAPMVDIARDARWGRIAEGSGEDPYLGAIMAAARVRGFQGRSLADPSSVLACAKHYVAYGAAEGGRDYNTVDVPERTLREVYLPPFRAALEAGVGTFMSAFNDLDGIPTSANWFTLTKILRREWGFRGFVVSDWNSIGELLNHGVDGTPAEAAKDALESGVDMDMVSDVYGRTLARLVKEGRVAEDTITEAARRVLRIKFQLGLFERPYTDPSLEKTVILAQEHVDMARTAAGKCVVLLKNANSLLPLRKDVGSIAVVGPLADDAKAPLGPWSADGQAENVVTLLQGIRAKLPGGARIHYSKGCEITGDGTSGFSDALKSVRDSDLTIVAVGEAADMSGEAASRAYLDLPGKQNDLIKAIQATGKPMVLVLMNGRPLTITWAAENVPAILECWFLGIQAGNAIADVLFGDVNPSGKLTATFPFTVGQVPIYYAHKSTGRPASAERFTSRYIDAPVAPLYPFGFGLSYTKFKYGNLQVSADSMGRTGSLTVSAEVENSGSLAGDEVVQFYIQDRVASTTRPVKQLTGFRKISLSPGEKRKVEFTVTPDSLRIYDRDMRYVAEPGAFKVWIGPSSAEGLEGGFELTGK